MKIFGAIWSLKSKEIILLIPIETAIHWFLYWPGSEICFLGSRVHKAALQLPLWKFPLKYESIQQELLMRSIAVPLQSVRHL